MSRATSTGAFQHRSGEGGDMARREHRRHGLARAFPHLAFRGQKTIAQDRPQQLLAHPRHPVIGRIVDQYMAHQPWIIGDDQRPANPGADRYPRPIVGGLAPQFEWIAVDDAHHLDKRWRLAARLGRRRLERGGLAVHWRFLSPSNLGPAGGDGKWREGAHCSPLAGLRASPCKCLANLPNPGLKPYIQHI